MNISVKEKTEPQIKAEAALLAKGHDVTVLWDSVFRIRGRGNKTRVNTVCGYCGATTSKDIYTLGKGHYCCDYCRVNKIQPKKAVVSPTVIIKSEAALAKSPNVSVEIDWGNVFYRNNKQCVNVKCNHCETTSERYVGGIIKAFSCEQCNLNVSIGALAKVNRTYLGSELGKVKSSCNVCNTVIASSSSDVRSRGLVPKCNTCLENKYTELANTYGFDFVSKQTAQHKEHGTRNTFITLKCRKDLTLTDVTGGALKKGYFECKECVVQGYRDSLSLKGCELIGTFHADDYAGRKTLHVKYKNQMGDVFTARSSTLKTGKFATTLDNHWSAAHSTYLIRNIFQGKTYYKIGTANVPIKRLKALKLLGESSVFTLASFPDRFGADKLESDLQTEFLQFKLDSEISGLFTGNKLRRKRVGQTERVYVKDGIHEWFTHEVYDILKHRYKLE